jgi:hypothetical protein
MSQSGARVADGDVLLSSVGRESNGIQSSSSRAAVGNGDWNAMTLLMSNKLSQTMTPKVSCSVLQYSKRQIRSEGERACRNLPLGMKKV